MVEFNQPGIELFKQRIHFACLPVKAENRPIGAIVIVSPEVLASVDNVFDDLFVLAESWPRCASREHARQG